MHVGSVPRLWGICQRRQTLVSNNDEMGDQVVQNQEYKLMRCVPNHRWRQTQSCKMYLKSVSRSQKWSLLCIKVIILKRLLSVYKIQSYLYVDVSINIR